MHREWYDGTAVRDLLGEGCFTSKSTLYSCLDRLVAHKDGMFEFLRDRWAGLFASDCRVILYDLTSTYFEVDGTKADESDLLRHGYSRDKRGDCLQVVIALVLTPDGFPLAYEVMPGNTSDKGTQMQFVDRLVEKFGYGGKLESRAQLGPFQDQCSEADGSDRDEGQLLVVVQPRPHPPGPQGRGNVSAQDEHDGRRPVDAVAAVHDPGRDRAVVQGSEERPRPQAG